MKPFDPYIKQRLAEESAELPDSVKEKIEAALSNLPEADTNQPIIPLRKQVHRLRRCLCRLYFRISSAKC